MDHIRNRLDRDLKAAVSRLGHLGGAVVMKEPPGTIRDRGPCADEVEGSQASECGAMADAITKRVGSLESALKEARP